MINAELTRRDWLTIAASNAIAAAVSSRFACSVWAAENIARRAEIRGEIVLPRAGHDWMSQQIEEPASCPTPRCRGG